MSNRPTQIQFRSTAIEPELHARGDSPGQVAARDLTRYYVLINQARLRVHEFFADPNEWALMREAIAGTPGMDYQPHLFVVSIEDAIKLDGAHIRFGIADADDLIQRLHSLTSLETVALLDTVERWWITQERVDAETTEIL